MTLRDLAEFEVQEPPARRARASRRSSGSAATCASSRCSSIPTAWRRAASRSTRCCTPSRARTSTPSGGFVVQGPMEWTVRAVGPRRDGRGPARRPWSRCAARTPVLLGDVADVREAPAVRRGIAHRLTGEVVSCRIVKQFGADTVQVAARRARGARRARARACPQGVQLRIVYDQSELVESALGGVGRAVLLGAVLVVLVLFAAARRPARGAARHAHAPALDRARRAAAARGRRRAQHDDARRPRDRGRACSSTRRSSSPRTSSTGCAARASGDRARGGARAPRSRWAGRSPSPRSIVDRRVPAAVRDDAASKGACTSRSRRR